MRMGRAVSVATSSSLQHLLGAGGENRSKNIKFSPGFEHVCLKHGHHVWVSHRSGDRKNMLELCISIYIIPVTKSLPESNTLGCQIPPAVSPFIYQYILT